MAKQYPDQLEADYILRLEDHVWGLPIDFAGTSDQFNKQMKRIKKIVAKEKARIFDKKSPWSVKVIERRGRTKYVAVWDDEKAKRILK